MPKRSPASAIKADVYANVREALRYVPSAIYQEPEPQSEYHLPCTQRSLNPHRGNEMDKPLSSGIRIRSPFGRLAPGRSRAQSICADAYAESDGLGGAGARADAV